ncbi:MAG: polysaccharide deacetylase family protein, partial [Rhodoferax sp.]
RPSALVWASAALHAAVLAGVVLRPSLWPWAIGAVLANHAVLCVAGLLPRCQWLGSNWTRLPFAAAARGEIAITIDDGPDPVVTPAVLDVLERHGVKATFFCIGTQAVRHPALCREIVRRGHAIENHSQTHGYGFALQGPRGFLRELQAAQQTLVTITGEAPVFFRAPAGLRNPFLDPVLQRLGLQLASWSRRAYDTRNGDADAVLRILTRSLRAGDILLLHDRHAARTAQGSPVILDVLPPLLAAIADARLRCVTLRAALA